MYILWYTIHVTGGKMVSSRRPLKCSVDQSSTPRKSTPICTRECKKLYRMVASSASTCGRDPPMGPSATQTKLFYGFNPKVWNCSWNVDVYVCIYLYIRQYTLLVCAGHGCCSSTELPPYPYCIEEDRLDVDLEDCWYARPQLFFKCYLRPKNAREPKNSTYKAGPRIYLYIHVYTCISWIYVYILGGLSVEATELRLQAHRQESHARGVETLRRHKAQRKWCKMNMRCDGELEQCIYYVYTSIY